MNIVLISCWKLLSFENPFEFILNLKSSFKTWKFNRNIFIFFSSCPKFFFKQGPWGVDSQVVLCACIQVYPAVWLNTWTLHHSTGFIFEIDLSGGQTFIDFNQIFKFQNYIWDFKFWPSVTVSNSSI